MTNLELLVSDLPKLIGNLKLTIGDSHEIMQQIIPIDNTQEKLREIQKLILQELQVNNIKNSAIATLPRTATVASLFIPNIGLIEPPLAAKFGNWETHISLNDLQKKIDTWIEWGYFLQALAADILSDIPLVNQLNSDINHVSLPHKFQALREDLKINLAVNNPKKLQYQFQKISIYQKDLLQIQQKIDCIFTTIKNSHSLLNILLGVSAFCGKSGFTLEWLDDDHELIISSDGRFQELTDILNECDFFQEEIAALIVKCETLIEQAEQILIKLEQQKTKKIVINNEQLEFLPKFAIKKKVKTAFILASSLIVLGFGSWKVQQHSQKLHNLNQETRAIANLKSAQKLATEAASLAQKPPHSLQVWQQAETKWYQAINLLNSIPAQTSVYDQAKNKLTYYRINYEAISQRVLIEKKAVANLELAHKLAIEATLLVQNSPYSTRTRQQAKEKWKEAINLLEVIPENSYVSIQAQETLSIYKNIYAAIRVR
ncbi:MAG: hypothetical protein RMX96_23800 [Nostoc sp. ChiSLP02]|nr:hypothetical protein [Nostoc sp. DedSLP05]MDZ8101082.1 hypothetical protein [Nostoc sp. DedSLP01]MDZ8187860.1 hypothetical protein [Nostoc sp. ChiSLP02]